MIQRDVCFKCYRPKTSCMCKHINIIDTNTRFIILMHPKEYRKTKNGTGHFTNLSLKNSNIYIGIDFSNHEKINEIIDNPNINSYVLYPGENSIELNSQELSKDSKENVIFIIDSTWPCSKKIIRLSKNIASLPKLSFKYTQESNFKIKTQPNLYCLSTIESVFCVLKLLNKQGLESINKSEFENFLEPFDKMVEYQLTCAKKSQIRNKAVVL
ncbi:tRNA-uridine aminocarboxypropyltransferase [Halarcobacter sp.]|uniref:tRNA-uridine aminocarboxypropyltransferase n=1 Tax=Halarcobacter sp. TaxID=2321133 RepID=UPI002AAB8E66|nr:tRNA-uridine aminocarboxypropyltransferase [Halarcobacter sp.]